MAINIFKKKEEAKKKEAPKKSEPLNVSPKKAKGKSLMAWRQLKYPYISEKATKLNEENKYIFVVSDEANKTEIKKAVEEIYKTKVVNVNIINIPKKRKRLGRYQGWKKGFKKAIVEIKKGEKIDVYPS